MRLVLGCDNWSVIGFGLEVGFLCEFECLLDIKILLIFNWK